jgi:hypothetical protein
MATWSNFEAELDDLSDECIQQLQSYVRLYRIGKFADARRLYDEELSSHISSHGVLIVEHSDALLAEGRFGALVQFLNESLKSDALTSPQKEYLSLMISLAEIYNFGSLRPALQNARMFRRTLEAIKWENFSTYQVCIMNNIDQLI